MNHISEKELKAIAKKYGRDAQELKDYVLDMESDGIRVDAEYLEDMVANGDL